MNKENKVKSELKQYSQTAQMIAESTPLVKIAFGLDKHVGIDMATGPDETVYALLGTKEQFDAFGFLPPDKSVVPIIFKR